ncbi:LysR family transcriptional regulator [Mycolicibacterium madagascariense]|uniref:LysR family transcriptional regulator n=2 Tax=Mycolicibacterium madagascariense TaxID=212765 RepID=A0A7I7XNJ2_9MYCO|nr:LysR family transcriptional regulator [Mycolicibacterium madagascariense]BBZ30809.1 LysR family transcriptional regulator [Mycolicibacterium madagascariense]
MADVGEPTPLTRLAPRVALLSALAADGNLTRAAAAAGVPQPTASRWLAALSEALGTPLLVPDGRRVRLTPAGACLADAAGRAMAELSAGLRQAEQEADPERGRVVLAFLHTMGERRVPDQLRAFRRKHPRVRFTLVQGAHEDLLDHVRHGRADLAMTAPLPASDEFGVLVLDTQHLVVLVPAEHPLAGRSYVRMAELADEQFIGMKPGYGLRAIVDELAGAAGFTPALAFEGEEVDTVRGLVAAGLGVAVVPPADPGPSPDAVEIALRPAAERRIGLVWAADRPLAPSAAAFLDFVGGRAVAQRRERGDDGTVRTPTRTRNRR